MPPGVPPSGGGGLVAPHIFRQGSRGATQRRGSGGGRGAGTPGGGEAVGPWCAPEFRSNRPYRSFRGRRSTQWGTIPAPAAAAASGPGPVEAIHPAAPRGPTVRSASAAWPVSGLARRAADGWKARLCRHSVHLEEALTKGTSRPSCICGNTGGTVGASCLVIWGRIWSTQQPEKLG